MLKAGSSLATTFTLDATDLVSGGTVQGSSGVDTLVISSTDADLTSTTVTSIEALKAGSASNTTFTLDAADLNVIGSISGSTGTDTLVVTSATINLGLTNLTSVEILKAGLSTATTSSSIRRIWPRPAASSAAAATIR